MFLRKEYATGDAPDDVEDFEDDEADQKVAGEDPRRLIGRGRWARLTSLLTVDRQWETVDAVQQDEEAELFQRAALLSAPPAVLRAILVDCPHAMRHLRWTSLHEALATRSLGEHDAGGDAAAAAVRDLLSADPSAAQSADDAVQVIFAFKAKMTKTEKK